MQEGSPKPLVSICSITYNHAPYIRQCLDGFLMQQCNFDYEIIINDDCSTDGTTDIIREYASKYPGIIKPIYHEENEYSKGVRGMFATYVFPKAQGKYIALCEGDDYWTDPLKLQKQVDFLESHPDYSMCCSDVNQYLQKFDITQFCSLSSGNEITLDNLIRKNMIHTPTVLCRAELVFKYTEYEFPNTWLIGDYPLWIWMAMNGKIHSQQETMACYRVLEESASHHKSPEKLFRFHLSLFDVRLYFNQRFHLGYHSIEKHYFKFVVKTCLKNRWCNEMVRGLYNFTKLIIYSYYLRLKTKI